MSKTLNHERRIDALRREIVKPKPEAAVRDATAPTSLAAPEPTPAAIIASAALKEPAAGSSRTPGPAHAPHPAPATSLNAVRPAHQRYSIFTFVMAFSVTLGIVRIVRTGLLRPDASAPAQKSMPPPPAPPRAAVSAVSDVSVAPSLPPRAPQVRAPAAAAPSPQPEDAALAEATRVYNLMETALRDAARFIPARPRQ